MSEVTRSGTRLGTSIGRHRIVRLIGGGRGGRVFECVGPEEQRVAVKVMRSARVHDVDRLYRERLTFERIKSAHTVRIIDVPVFNSAPYVVMELVEGESLASLLEKGALRTIDVLHLARAVATGLRDAWALGVAHGDLRPCNVLIPEEKLEAAKVVDFGLAPRVEGIDGIRGTPEYMAPELLRGTPPDALSDLYALGCMIFEVLSGSPPFVGSPAAVLKAQGEQRHKPLDAAMPGAPHFMVDLVDRLLEKDRAKRLMSWPECLVAIDHALQGLKLPPPQKPQLPEVTFDIDDSSGDFDGVPTMQVHLSPARPEPARRDPPEVEDVAASLSTFTPAQFDEFEDLLADGDEDPFAPPPANELAALLAEEDDDPFAPPRSVESFARASPPAQTSAPPAPPPAAPLRAGSPHTERAVANADTTLAAKPSGAMADVFTSSPPAPARPAAPRAKQVTTTEDAGALLDELFGAKPAKKR